MPMIWPMKRLMADLIDLARDWQTLISAFIALGAAWLTLRKIDEQIQDSRLRDRAAREARQLAARAALPDALSDIATYTHRTMEFLAGKSAEVPPAPERGIATVKWAVEFCDGTAARALFNLTSEYQIQRTRLTHHLRDDGIEDLDRMHDCLRVRLLSDRLYGYARGLREDAAIGVPSADETVGCLGQFAGRDDPFVEPRLRETLVARIRGARPIPAPYI